MVSKGKKILRPFFLICTGGMLYYNFEIFARGFSHISMFLCGGFSFYSVGLLNEGRGRHLPLLLQMFLGSLIITFYELITGLIVNLRLHLHVWDYSQMPYNYKGQICLPFSLLWFLCTPLCIWLDDFLRHYLFNQEKPSYFFWKRKCKAKESIHHL